MMLTTSASKRGFTLLELVIALGVLGLLLGGLFQLTAAGSRQISDQLTAQQLQLWGKATQSYLTGQRADNSGQTFYQYSNASCALNTTATPLAAAGALAVDITNNIQCYRQGMLPATSSSGGSYKVILKRNANITANGIDYANYIVMISIAGGKDFERKSMGSIAAYVGANGANILPGYEEAADDPSTPCDEATQNTVRGNYGSTCVNLSIFNPAWATWGTGSANRPAILSFINMLDVSTGTGEDDKYLWRKTGPTPMYNTMAEYINMGGYGMLFNSTVRRANGITGVTGGMAMQSTLTPATSAITGVTGGISLNPTTATPTLRSIIGVTGGIALDDTVPLVAKGITGATGGIQTNGGSLLTGGGSIQTATGAITTLGGDISLNGSPTNGNLSAGDGTFTGTIYSGAFIYQNSDRNIKKDIKQLEGQLVQLLKIKGVSYVLKSSGEKSIGIIAQDVEEVYPELVAERGGIKKVNYTGLIGPIIESLRELKVENDNLKQRVEVLEKALRETK